VIEFLNKIMVIERMVTLDTNATWELVILPKDKKTIGCKWVYKVKHNVNRFINKYKARLVTKGSIQIYNINYEETYNLVVKMTIVKIVVFNKKLATI
jgi:DhnA family fructose-bisphosphate aldolase class Ia